nr:hypothetical protein HmN_000256700 [Hymenolepis microstoma]
MSEDAGVEIKESSSGYLADDEYNPDSKDSESVSNNFMNFFTLSQSKKPVESNATNRRFCPIFSCCFNCLKRTSDENA